MNDETTYRVTSRTEKTTVQYVAKPMGRARENGPHLADLRAFVQACDGLPDDLLVRTQYGHLDEGGRQNVVLSVTHVVDLDSLPQASDG